MLALITSPTLFISQADPGVADRQVLVAQLKTKSGPARALEGARVTAGRVVGASGKIVPSSADEFLREAIGCEAGEPRGGQSWRKDGSSEFAVDWSCAGKDAIVTQVTMRDGKITNLNWTRGPVIILAAPPVAR